MSISDNHGRSLTFGYGSDGMLSTVSTPDGSSITYNHDPQHRLTSVTYPTGTRTYQYGDASHANALTGLVDENNNTYSTWTYDSLGRGTSTALAGGVNSATLLYNPDRSVRVTDALGTQRTYTFQNTFGFPQVIAIQGPFCGDCGFGKSATYDGNGSLATSIDWNNNVTAFNFQANGARSDVTQAQGTSLQRTTSVTWDTVLQNPLEETVTDAGGLKSKIDVQYNTAGEPIARCQADPSVSAAVSYTCSNTGTAPAGVRRWTYTYCTVVDGTQCPLLGLMRTVTDPLNNVTTLNYYVTDDSTCASAPMTCPHRAGDLWKVSSYVTSTLSLVTTFLTYDGAGRPLSMTDPNGVETDLAYNARGWLTKRTVLGTGNSATGAHITSYTYDNIGQVKKVTEPDGSSVGFTYDAAHRLTDIASSDASSNVIGSVHFTLDNAGNRTQEDTKDPSNTVKRSVVRIYNQLSQLQTSVNADGTTPNANVTYDANGNTKLVTDGRGYITDNAFDALNRVISTVRDEKPGDSTHVNAFSQYAYDALDRTTKVTDPQGLNTLYQYDGLNNLTKLTSPDTGIATSTYDAVGNLKTRTDARGITATYSYDALNRMTGIAYPTSALNVSFTYDTTFVGTCATYEMFPIGHLTYISDGSGYTKLCYDRFGNMVRKTQATAGITFRTIYAYDLAGHLTQTTTPKSTLIKYTRDGAGRVIKVAYRRTGQSTDTTVVSNVTYYPYGPVASITYGNGRVLTRTYDKDYVVSGVSDMATGGLALAFGRDVMGNLTQEQIGTTGTVGNNFVYDGLNRLTDVNGLNNALVAAYTYDTTGNRKSKQVGGSTQVYTYPTTSHELIDVAGIGRTYDAAGDTTAIGTNAKGFVYDSTGRMSQFNVNGTAQMQYKFNAFGQRVEKLPTGNTVGNQFTAYDESGHVLGDYDNTTGHLAIREMVWMDGMPVGVLNGSTGTLAYVEPDQLGTPRVAIDATSNAVVWNWSPLNDPFGETQPSGTLTLNLRMPGQVWDAESGLSYNYFRDYDSGTGRYVESDPIGLNGAISTYGYVGGNPLSNWDPYGLMAWPPALPQGFVDFVAGTGDTASFGLTKYIRDANDIEGANTCSSAYGAGRLAGIPLTVGTIAAGGMAVNILLRAAGGAATLYHFTSAAAAADIASDGAIAASSSGMYGPGVYATAFNSATWATASGAASTEAVIAVDGSGALATPWPGTFRFLSSVPVP